MQHSFQLSFRPKRDSSADRPFQVPLSSPQAHKVSQNINVDVSPLAQNGHALHHGHFDSLRGAREEMEVEVEAITYDPQYDPTDDVPSHSETKASDSEDELLDDEIPDDDSEESQIEAFWQTLCDDYDLDLDGINLIRELIPGPWEHPVANEYEDWLEWAIFRYSEEDGKEAEKSSVEYKRLLATQTASFIDARDRLRRKRPGEYEKAFGVGKEKDEWFFNHCNDAYREGAVDGMPDNGPDNSQMENSDDELLDDDSEDTRVEAYYEQFYDLADDDIDILIEIFPDPCDHPLELVDQENQDYLENKIFDARQEEYSKELLLLQTNLFIDARDMMRGWSPDRYDAAFGVGEDRDEWFRAHCDGVYRESAVVEGVSETLGGIGRRKESGERRGG